MSQLSVLRIIVATLISFAVLAGIALSQEQAPPQQPPGGGGGGQPSPGPGPGAGPGAGQPGTGSPFPGQGQQRPGFPDPGQQRTPFPEMQRPIFLSGKVMMEDGTPPPESVVIERVCHGRHMPEGYTDSKGRFSIQLGQNQMAMMADASVSSDPGGFGGTPGFGNPSAGRGGPMGGGLTERDLMGCELRASLPGYQSSLVNLSGRRLMDNPDVGTILLKKIGGVQGFTYSATSYMAPKEAKKSFEKGQDQAKKQKWDNALKEYQKAVDLYPKYAVAWYELGSVQLRQKDTEAARTSFSKALEADDKYVNPYLQLALLSAQDQKWQDVADTTDRVIRLNPVSFPHAYFYNSVANYNLQKFDAAEKSAREAVKLDTNHRMPKAEHLLGVLLAMKQDYSGAVQHMRAYLTHAPQANDIDQVKKQLAEIEKFLGDGQPAAQAQPQQQ